MYSCGHQFFLSFIIYQCTLYSVIIPHFKSNYYCTVKISKAFLVEQLSVHKRAQLQSKLYRWKLWSSQSVENKAHIWKIVGSTSWPTFTEDAWYIHPLKSISGYLFAFYWIVTGRKKLCWTLSANVSETYLF